MRNRIKQVLGLLAVATAASLAVVRPAPTEAAQSLQDFIDFSCPGECPVGKAPCCAQMDPICVPGPCQEM